MKLSKELLGECWKIASMLGIGLSDYIRLALIRHTADVKQRKERHLEAL